MQNRSQSLINQGYIPMEKEGVMITTYLISLSQSLINQGYIPIGIIFALQETYRRKVAIPYKSGIYSNSDNIS